jgi:hypothetical protein
VEFALAFLVFILLVFAVFDFGHLFFTEMEVQNAVQEAARFGSTGSVLPVPGSPGSFLSPVDSIKATLESDARGMQFQSIQISSVNAAGLTSTGAGGPGDLMTVAATVNMPLVTPVLAQMFPNGKFTFTSSVTIMNEQF